MLGGTGEPGSGTSWWTSIPPSPPSTPTTTVLGATETRAVASARRAAERASSASTGKGTTRNSPRTGRPVQWRHRAAASSQQSRSTCQGSRWTSRSQRGSRWNRTRPWERTSSAAVAATAAVTRPRATSSAARVSTKASHRTTRGTYQAIQNPTLRAMGAPARRLGQAYGDGSVGMVELGQHAQEQGGRPGGRAGVAAADGDDLAPGQGRVDQLDPGQGAGGQLAGDGAGGDQGHPEAALDHLLGRLDVVQLQHAARQHPGLTEGGGGELEVAGAAPEQDQHLAGQVGHAGLAAGAGPGQPVPGAGDQDQGVGEQRDGLDLLVGQGADDAELHLVVQDHVQDLLGGAGPAGPGAAR